MKYLKPTYAFMTLALCSTVSFANIENRPNISMMEYSKVFDRSGNSLDFVFEGRSEGKWHCETVDSNGIGHNCTMKTSSNSEDNSRSKDNRLLKMVSYIGPVDVNEPFFLKGNEQFIKDWTCEWVDKDGIGHNCDWVDVIIVDG
ncbi:MAG: hypothetical protein QNJ78_15770 [Gammaproteobacteria bacterium]|nr:hypothetical protein [Gammaproteobacteria bacterium]